MIKSKFAKVFIMGMCITMLSTGVAFANTGSGRTDVAQPFVGQAQQPGSVSVLLEKQKEIDKFIFDLNAKEIADKGFKVTYTGQVGNYVEIGITPYNEANAEYLYKALGKDIVKVVEGEQAVLMTAATGSPDTSVSSPAQVINDDVLKKQSEIDQYLFEQHKDEIAKQSFKITHTVPMDSYVEIGITPYNEANADYLYNALGRDKVKVVEGQQVTTMGIEPAIGEDAELYATTSVQGGTQEDEPTSSLLLLALACAAGVAVLGGAVIVDRRRRVARK